VQYYSSCSTFTDSYCTSVCNHEPANCDSQCCSTSPTANQGTWAAAAHCQPVYTDTWCEAMCTANPSDPACGTCCLFTAASPSPVPSSSSAPIVP
jgi:hypothetical protein